MVFLGRSFCGARNSLDYTSTNIENINSVKLQNGIFDEFRISKNVETVYTTEIPEDWDFDTIIHAKFENNLSGGNVDFVLSQISAIKIKRRRKDDSQWLTMFEVPINNVDDFNTTLLDRYVRASTEYEYALIPIINGSEGGLNINSIFVEFDGIFIVEKNISYGTLLNINMSTSKNKPFSVVATQQKYPFVVTNGEADYYTGTTSALFVEQIPNDYGVYDWNYYYSYKYREDILDFLNNGKAKILKHFDGRMFLVKVTDGISQEEGTSNYFPTISFNWAEIGNSENAEDLYINDFIDYFEVSSVLGGVVYAL